MQGLPFQGHLFVGHWQQCIGHTGGRRVLVLVVSSLAWQEQIASAIRAARQLVNTLATSLAQQTVASATSHLKRHQDWSSKGDLFQTASDWLLGSPRNDRA